MRRSPLKRKTPLRRKPASRFTTKPSSPPQPGEAEWKQRRTGRCVNCGTEGPVVLHHAVQESYIRSAGGWCWDPRWAIPLGAPLPWGGRCSCHGDHHAGGDGRLFLSVVPVAARSLAVETLGEGPAELYFERRYRSDDGATER